MNTGWNLGHYILKCLSEIRQAFSWEWGESKILAKLLNVLIYFIGHFAKLTEAILKLFEELTGEQKNDQVQISVFKIL